MDGRLLKEGEVSELVGISLSALRNWRVKKKGFPFCKIGKSVRYRPEDLNSYLEANKRGGDSDG